MSLSSILSQVATVVKSVAGSDRVQSGLRHFRSREHWKAAALDPAMTVPFYHIWFVTRGTSSEEHHSTGSNIRTHEIVIAGYYSCIDPTVWSAQTQIGNSMGTEIQFSALVEGVCDALRNDAYLHGGNPLFCGINATPPQVAVWDVRTLDETECHYCEIRMEVEEELIIDYTVTP